MGCEVTAFRKTSVMSAIAKLSRLSRRLLFQRRLLREPLTYAWWRRLSPKSDRIPQNRENTNVLYERESNLNVNVIF